MGKRIGRSRHRLRMPQGASWAESLQNELEAHRLMEDVPIAASL